MTTYKIGDLFLNKERQLWEIVAITDNDEYVTVYQYDSYNGNTITYSIHWFIMNKLQSLGPKTNLARTLYSK